MQICCTYVEKLSRQSEAAGAAGQARQILINLDCLSMAEQANRKAKMLQITSAKGMNPLGSLGSSGK